MDVLTTEYQSILKIYKGLCSTSVDGHVGFIQLCLENDIAPGFVQKPLLDVGIHFPQQVNSNITRYQCRYTFYLYEKLPNIRKVVVL